MVSIVENTEADLNIICMYDTRVLGGFIEGKWSNIMGLRDSY